MTDSSSVSVTMIGASLRLAVLVWAVGIADGAADSWTWPELRDCFSDDRSHRLRIEPAVDWKKPGHCRATQFRGDTELWSRHLINDTAPVKVVVADSGDYVVTIDEWHKVGTLPVVIYGSNGRLIRVHGLDSLGLEADYEHMTVTMSGAWWNENAVSFFGPEKERVFFIRLHWGKWISLDLRQGDLMDAEWLQMAKGSLMPPEKWRELQKFRMRHLAEKAKKLLVSKTASERETGAMVCGREKLADSVSELRKLLHDEAWFTRGSGATTTRVYHVRAAAKTALEALGQEVDGVVVSEPYNQP